MSVTQHAVPAPSVPPTLQQFSAPMHDMMETGQDFWRRGWSLGTSSNYSVVVERDPLTLLMTGSGFDKGRLQPDQFVLVNEEGRALQPTTLKPSAEALLHVVLARSAKAGAVLHTHSVAGTVLSELHQREGRLTVTGYEMLKGLEGINTHEATAHIDIFANTQDIAALAQKVEAAVLSRARQTRYAFLISGHGLYAWGADLAMARRHVEVLEFLLEVTMQRRLLSR